MAVARPFSDDPAPVEVAPVERPGGRREGEVEAAARAELARLLLEGARRLRRRRQRTAAA